jgi:hypothetical protein
MHMPTLLRIAPFLALIGLTPCFGNEGQVSDTVPSSLEAGIKDASIADCSKDFKPFTGKISGNRVRLRAAPSLEGSILKELSAGSLCVVTGEVDEFYAIKPEASVKGYVFRSYVLDGVVEASNLNVRLEPDMGSIVLVQLKQGDKVQGTVCAGNPKWLSIDLPKNVRFFVAKNYVTNLGDESLFTTIQTRRQQVSSHLSALEISIKQELAKPFSQIKLLPYVNELKVIISQNEDLPDLVEYAQTLVRTLQEQYLSLSQSSSGCTAIEPLDQIALSNAAGDSSAAKTPQAPRLLSFVLEQQENGLIEEAIASGKCVNRESFYTLDQKQAEELVGQLVPYERPVKNRPGDFILVNIKTKSPVAYLYSNKVDLNAHVGQTVRLLVTSRPNHHFALPAYFVQELQVK